MPLLGEVDPALQSPIRGEHRGHVTSSPPITAHLDPELRGHALGHGEVVEEDDGDGECEGENPGAGHQPLGRVPLALHFMATWQSAARFTLYLALHFMATWQSAACAFASAPEWIL